MQFNELVSEYVIKMDSERIRQHTHDDFGLGPDWVFIGGGYGGKPGMDSVWRSVWGKPTNKAHELFDMRVNAMEFRRYRHLDSSIRVYARDDTGISRRELGTIEEIPDELQFMLWEL